MNENSGNNPFDPRMLPSQPSREPLAGVNGPANDRIMPPVPPLPRQLADAPPALRDKPPEQKDAFREIVETVVFVVVLVLLLKAFLAEAFVIPTGSMATTLLGYHRNIECPECHFRFPLNMSQQMDFSEGETRVWVESCKCPNCLLPINSKNAPQFFDERGKGP